jgi:hypothetical protein
MVMKNIPEDELSQKISRQEALKKAGKYAAFTAAASAVLLTPVRSQDGAGAGSLGAASGFSTRTGSAPPDGGSGSPSPFTKPESGSSGSSGNSGLRDSPWK